MASAGVAATIVALIVNPVQAGSRHKEPVPDTVPVTDVPVISVATIDRILFDEWHLEAIRGCVELAKSPGGQHCMIVESPIRLTIPIRFRANGLGPSDNSRESLRNLAGVLEARAGVIDEMVREHLLGMRLNARKGES